MPSPYAEFYAQGNPNVGVQFMPATETYPEEGQKGFANPALVGRLRELEPTSYLLLGEEFAQIAPEVTSAHFNEIDELGLTREESVNQVYFGQLVLNGFEGEKATELVAVKPFRHSKDAAHEAGAMHTVNGLDPRRGAPLSYEPLGFYKMGDGRTALLTRYDHPVRTQDTVFWHPDREPTTTEIARGLNHGAFALASLHHYGLTHGDAQVKNIAYDNRGVRYVDLTALASHAPDVGVDPFTVRQRIGGDLRKYVTSLAVKSCLETDEYIGPVSEVFAPMYVRIASASESRVPEEARFRSDEIVEMML
jgi:hypothetical protein